jgi:hypothetical protein
VTTPPESPPRLENNRTIELDRFFPRDHVDRHPTRTPSLPLQIFEQQTVSGKQVGRDWTPIKSSWIRDSAAVQLFRTQLDGGVQSKLDADSHSVVRPLDSAWFANCLN